MTIVIPQELLPTSSFSCGPAQALPHVRQTPLYRTLFERNHRAEDISSAGLLRQTTENLRTLLHVPHDYTILFFPGGATAAMDAVLWSLTQDTLSGIDMGAFSHLWCEKLATRVPGIKRNFVHAGKDFIPQSDPDFKASLVILTPNETSTGVQLPNAFLERAWQARGEETLIAWDATSCAGGRDLPASQYDVMLFSLQKCFGAGGGTAAVILSPRAVKRIEEVKKMRQIPYFLDLSHALAFAPKYQTLNTPSIINIWICNESCKWMLSKGGIKTMEQICRRHADYLTAWAQQSTWVRPLIANADYRSFTTMTFEIISPALTGETIAQTLLQTGRPNLADGLKKYRTLDKNSFRVACFPFIDPDGQEQYKKLTAALDFMAQRLMQN